MSRTKSQRHPLDVHWDAMVLVEPNLARLIAEAELRGESNWRCYEGFKRQLYHLVGWGASKPELRGCDCYSTAIRKLTEALHL
jgi:hypothetical protein